MPSRDPENGLDRRGHVGVSAAVVAAAALLVLSVPAVQWQLGTPRLGLDLRAADAGRLVVASVEGGGSADAAGVQPGDTLLSVGRVQPPSDPAADRRRATVLQLEVLNGYREGERVGWSVIRDGDRRTLEAALVGGDDHVTVSRAVVFGVFWLIACFLLWARPERKTVRHLAYTILALTPSVLYLSNRWMALDTTLGATIYQAHALGGALGPALVIHYGVIFPVCTLSDRARRRVLAATYGFYFATSFLVSQALFVRALGSPGAPYALTPPALEALHYGRFALFTHIADYLVCGLFMFRTWRRVEAEKLKDQIKWVLWAVLLTAGIDLLASGAAVYAGGFGWGDFYPFRNYLYLLIAGGLLVAVFRHDLFDVDRVIRGTVIYFSTVSALFVLFAATEALVSEVVRETLATESSAAGTAAAAVLSGAVFQPLRAWIRARTLEVIPVDPEEEVLTDA